MSTPDEQGPLYVGYLPLPRRYRMFIALLIPAFMLTLSITAAFIASTQRDPGDAVWNASEERTWSGVLLAHPYPMLVADDGTTHLVVEIGKVGAQAREQLTDAPVAAEVRGFELHRGGRHIIELAPEPDAITVTQPSASSGPNQPPTQQYLDEVIYTGEIIDGKCFLGAMKPGDGKAHKACAILCIQGGLPPMIAVRENPFDPNPTEIALLLIDGSTEVPDAILDMVARPVEIRGNRSMIGSLMVIDTTTGNILPLP